MKMKISLKEWTEIGRYNYAAKWLRSLCSYALIKKDDKTFERQQYLSLFMYVLIFIPIHFLQAICLLWTGGLTEFEVYPRFIGRDILSKGNNAYERAEQIWNRSNKD